MKSELRKFFATSLRMAREDRHPQGWSAEHIVLWAMRCGMKGPIGRLP